MTPTTTEAQSTKVATTPATAGGEATRYLRAVRAELDDLTEDEREELLDGLEADLCEAAAESEGPLDRRLGPPRDYAAELRRSAGLAARGEPRRHAPMMSRARAGQARLLAHPWVGSLRHFLPELRPGWWVARGYLTVAAFSVLSGGDEARSAFPVPTLNGSELVGLVLAAAAVVLSVRLGRGAPRRWSRPLAALDVAIVAATLLVVADLRAGPHVEYVNVDGGVTPYADGSFSGPFADVTNIYPYASDGTPLEAVLLFDQYGRSIDGASLPAEVTPDGMYLERQFPIGSDGSPVTNSYPIEQSSLDPETGRGMPGPGRPSIEVPSTLPAVAGQTTSTTSTTSGADVATTTVPPTSTVAPGSTTPADTEPTVPAEGTEPPEGEPPPSS